MPQQQSLGSFEFARLKAEVDNAIRSKDFSRTRRLLRPIVLSVPPTLPPKDVTWARQKLALATYKDSELQTEEGLEEALRILQAENLETTAEPETLNLPGAAHKRLWEITGTIGSCGSRGHFMSAPLTRDEHANRSTIGPTPR
jgi:hypothetical protein